MKHSPDQILRALDDCAAAYTFPMLDNGYIYPAATRMTAFRSATDWALAIEVFGFSYRGELPDTSVYTFSTALCNRAPADHYASKRAHRAYLEKHPHDELRGIYPIDESEWIDQDEGTLVASAAHRVSIRGVQVPLPGAEVYAAEGIARVDSARVHVFELCRALVPTHRDALLATDAELRVNVPPDMVELIRLDHWHHPDLAGDERPSGSATFQQIARVMTTGDVAHYAPTQPPNTHWQHWPDAGNC